MFQEAWVEYSRIFKSGYNKSRKTNLKEDIYAFKACRADYKRTLKSAQRDYYLNFLDPRLDENSIILRG